MYSLTIVFGPQATTWTLLFKEKEKAEETLNTAKQGGTATVTDDFGQTAIIAHIHAVMMEDLELSKEAHAVKAVHQARTMAMAETMARSDPELKTAHAQAQQRARLAGGPPIISTIR